MYYVIGRRLGSGVSFKINTEICCIICSKLWEEFQGLEIVKRKPGIEDIASVNNRRTLESGLMFRMGTDICWFIRVKL
jgi:hypothetical protein